MPRRPHRYRLFGSAYSVIELCTWLGGSGRQFAAGIGAILYALPVLGPRLTPDHLAAAYITGLTG